MEAGPYVRFERNATDSQTHVVSLLDLFAAFDQDVEITYRLPTAKHQMAQTTPNVSPK